MIAEISPPGSGLAQTLQYNFSKVEKNVADILLVSGLSLHKQKDITFLNALAKMKEMLPPSRVKNPVFHVSLNPHPDDRLSENDLVNIAYDYMEEMGYGQQPCIVFKHNDIAREHIHIVSLRVNREGKKISDRFEKLRSKKIVGELEEKYGLVKTQNITESEKDNIKLIPINPTKGNMKEQIKQIVKAVFMRYDFSSIGELDAILQFYGVSVKKTNPVPGRKNLFGVVFTAINQNGKGISPPITGRELGKGFRLREISTKLKDSKKAIEDKSKEIKTLLTEITSKQISKEDFLLKLAEKGIRTVLRETADNRIYGVTFVSDKDFFAVNGSAIDRKFSAKFFNDYFNQAHHKQQQNKESTFEERQQNKLQENKELFSFGGGSSSYTGLLSDQTTTDYKELAWQRKLKARAKRRKL